MGVKISVNKQTGDIKLEGVDIIGYGCVWELDRIVRLLDAKVLEVKKKPEFYTTYKKIKVRG